ncbi:hypothetical protein ACFLRC_01775 [Candidatus Altiarchaeota archaeon]
MMRWLLIGFVLAGLVSFFVPFIPEILSGELPKEYDPETTPIACDFEKEKAYFQDIITFTILVFLVGLFLIYKYWRTKEKEYLKAGILGPIIYLTILFIVFSIAGMSRKLFAAFTGNL